MSAVSDWMADSRYGSRKLLQSPAFLSIAVISMALGIGATGTRAEPRTSWNYPDYAAFRDQVTRFNGLCGF